MPALRILVLAPWPLLVPRNGGQLRACAIVRAYREAGHEVHGVGIYDAGRTPRDECSPSDVAFTPEVVRLVTARVEQGDDSVLAIWRAVADADDCRSQFAALVRSFRPDVVQFEEPFLWPLVRRLRDEGLLHGATVVHSSYNFETTAWSDLRRAGAQVTPATLRDIAAIENQIAAECALTVTVSRQDAEAFRALGAGQVCVAANGTDGFPHEVDARPLAAYLRPGTPHALFVSSGHPPNAHGFRVLAARARRGVEAGEIMVCGTVSGLLRSGPLAVPARPVLDRCRLLGWVAPGLLAALYATARVTIIPKTLGGGSNLKTAEALASGRPLVATRLAFSGFEAYATLPGVTVVDEPDAFWEAVDARLANPCPEPIRRAEAMRGLLWSECLRPMVSEVERVAGSRLP